MTNLYIMHGYIGSGKTTFAKRLEKETGAIRFNHDEWMIHFYGVNPPQESFSDYYARIDKMIWDMAGKFLDCHVDVILDFGFWTRAGRDTARDFAKKHSAGLFLYRMDTSQEVARQRLQLRTENMPEGQLFIDLNAFDTLYDRFQPLMPDELNDKVIGVIP